MSTRYFIPALNLIWRINNVKQNMYGVCHAINKRNGVVNKRVNWRPKDHYLHVGPGVPFDVGLNSPPPLPEQTTDLGINILTVKLSTD